ncbi:hypothetical protein SAMN02745121_07327 [Nannocystis exedens]|uniref:Uncharacterized protein n=1 Tax=Nannocystis exedens TaxID=54 RepID=A0A1I2GKB7_9BACT|nr:hypothetical protein [Nannocystis exedens]PCC73579.1 hypothetical protein NAEX_06667 [Nannocystis exedens]SFF17410.1 hypothetical protein SAMN02745121_07327 [Nannocystis exedens]
MTTYRITASIALAFALACGAEKGDSDSTTGESPGTDGSASSEGESGSSTSGKASEPTSSGGPLTTTGGNSEETATSDDTITAGETPPAGPCEAFCEHSIACEQGEPTPLEVCLSTCAEELDAVEGECHAASVAALACLTGLTCEQLESVDEGDPGPCEAALALQEECFAGCSFGGGGDIEGTFCEWILDCPLEPNLKMVCDAESCQCFEDDQPVGECEAEGICLSIDMLAAKANACCGIPEMG